MSVMLKFVSLHLVGLNYVCHSLINFSSEVSMSAAFTTARTSLVRTSYSLRTRLRHPSSDLQSCLCTSCTDPWTDPGSAYAVVSRTCCQLSVDHLQISMEAFSTTFATTRSSFWKRLPSLSSGLLLDNRSYSSRDQLGKALRWNHHPGGSSFTLISFYSYCSSCQLCRRPVGK